MTRLNELLKDVLDTAGEEMTVNVAMHAVRFVGLVAFALVTFTVMCVAVTAVALSYLIVSPTPWLTAVIGFTAVFLGVILLRFLRFK